MQWSAWCMPDFLIVAKLFLTEYIVDTLVKVKCMGTYAKAFCVY